jgi:hypothetical protein
MHGALRVLLMLERSARLSMRRIALFMQACAVVSIGMSDVGVAAMGDEKGTFVTLVDRIPRFEAY